MSEQNVIEETKGLVDKHSGLTVFQAIDAAMELLMQDGINENEYFDEIPGRSGKSKVLNVHGVRLIASFTTLRIRETKVLETGNEDIITVYAVAGFENERGGYESQVEEAKRYPSKKEGEPGLPNKNALAVAFTRAERNAMLGLMPARYIVQRIQQVTVMKTAQLEEKDHTINARESARERARHLEGIGGNSTEVLDEVKAQVGIDLATWGSVQWVHLEKKIEDEVIKIEEKEPKKEIDTSEEETSEVYDEENVDGSEPEPETEIE